MCDEHSMGFPHLFRFGTGLMACSPYKASKETQIKGLEAMKSRLEDFIKQIDERIVELEKSEKT